MKPIVSGRSRTRQSGSAILEFAFGSGVLMATFTGTFQFGYAFYIYNNLQTAVNNGAKYAALRTYESTTNSPSSCFQTAVQNMVAYGDPTGTSTAAAVPGLTPGNVSLTVTFGNGVPALMTTSVVSYTITTVFTNITLRNKPQVSYPFLGRYAPTNTCVP